MSTDRYRPTATRLRDGRVLVTGGLAIFANTASTELYDPATDTWSAAASMSTPRQGHTATLLPDGRVLITGGVTESAPAASAELYDPATNTWSPAASMSTAREGHTATLLDDGRVLVSGRSSDSGAVASAELYDPAGNTWSPADSMSSARLGQTATLLRDGRVLVAGGYVDPGAMASAELYAPAVVGSLPAVVRDSTNWMLRDSLTSGPHVQLRRQAAGADHGRLGRRRHRTAGTFESGVFKLNNANDASAPDITFAFGDARGFPVAGDFDADGSDDVAVLRRGLWRLRLSTGDTRSFTYGTGSWPATIPVSGDWDGDSRDGIGTATATWALRHDASAGPADAGSFVFGTPNASYPVTGDWDADATDTAGVKSNKSATSTLTNSHTTLNSDITFDFGLPNDLPLTW